MNDVNDAISKQQAIETFKDCAVNGVGIDGIVDALEQLSPIQPKRGKWILKTYRWECGQCGCLIRRANPFKGNIWNYNYCPNCGADMRGEQNG